jgi:hypothetical protein
MRSPIQGRVFAELVRVCREATAQGRDGLQAIYAAFPGVPGLVAGEAWAEAQEEDAEAWWNTVEKTIDAEVIPKAIGGEA